MTSSHDIVCTFPMTMDFLPFEIFQELGKRIIPWSLDVSHLEMSEDYIKSLILKRDSQMELDATSNEIHIRIDPRKFTRDSINSRWTAFLRALPPQAIFAIDDDGDYNVWYHPAHLPPKEHFEPGSLIKDLDNRLYVLDQTLNWASLEDQHRHTDDTYIIPYHICQTVGYSFYLRQPTKYWNYYQIKGLALNKPATWYLGRNHVAPSTPEEFDDTLDKTLAVDPAEFSLDFRAPHFRVFYMGDWQTLETDIIPSHIVNQGGWHHLANQAQQLKQDIYVQISCQEQLNLLNFKIRVIDIMSETKSDE